MNRVLFQLCPSVLAAVVISVNAFAQLPVKVGDQEVPSLAPLVSQTAPAVVNIATQGTVRSSRNPLMEDPFFRRFFGVPQQRERQVRSAGSGVIVDADKGYVLTNHHVIERADQIEVVLNDNRSLKATVVGSDPGTDIAVLLLEKSNDLVEMPLGDSEELQVGDFVVAIGNPFGLQHTVTSGIVSALGRQGINRDGYEDFIQTDASINPGNSGGALINLKGELVGINSVIFSRSGGNIGIGFAIPVNIAKSIMAQIIEFGEVRRGLLGVSISDFNTETAEAIGVEAIQGALVQEVMPDSAAEKAGVEVGDVVISVDEVPIKSAADLRTNIGLKRSGETVKLVLIRNGDRETVTAMLDELDANPVMTAGELHPGLAGAQFSSYNGEADNYSGRGVVVDSVDAGSPAAFSGLRPHDIITSLNNQRVNSIKELREVAKDQNLLLLRIRRGNRALLLQIR